MKTKTQFFILITVIFIATILLASDVVYAEVIRDPDGTTHQIIRDKHGKKIGERRVEHVSCSNHREVCEGQCSVERDRPEREPKPVPVPTPTPTTTTSQPSSPLLTPNPNWVPILGYTDSFNHCNNLCAQYQQSNCDGKLAIQYCSSIVSLDLNKNGKIDANEIGTAPSGTKNCETNARCYDIVDNCICGNMPLNLATCITLFFQNYLRTGLTTVQALQNIAQDVGGSCQPPRV